jgi:hypothetical protein
MASAPPLFVDWRVSSSSSAIARSFVRHSVPDDVANASAAAATANSATDVAMLDLSASIVPRKVSSAGSGSAASDQRRGSAPNNHRRSPMHGRVLNRSSSAFALARYSSHESLSGAGNMSLAARVAAFVNLEQQQQQQQSQSQQQQAGASGASSLNVSPMRGAGGSTLNGALVYQSRRDELPSPIAKKPRSRRSSLGIDVAGTHAHNSLFGSGIDSDLDDEDEFDDFGSESSFSSVGSVGLSALTIDHESPLLTNSPVRRPVVRRRPSETALRPSAAAAVEPKVSRPLVPASVPASATMAIGCTMTAETHGEFVAGAVGAGERSANFVVQKQPKEKQRKSYRNENRYLAPNPLSVQFVGEGVVPSAVVEVMLADGDGRPLEYERQMELIGERTRPLTADGTAGFSLKMHDTSRGEWIRLLFVVRYSDVTRPNEWLFTAQFRVDTNIRKVAAAAAPE